MDPYQILGIPRDCTRDEVKDAFRARSWQAHPDRGGDAASFVRLCQAYKTILADLDRFPRSKSAKPARPGRRRWSSHRKAPDPNWEADLVVTDKPPPLDRTPQPPDPNWEPELVVLDEPPPAGAPADLPSGRAKGSFWPREFTQRAGVKKYKCRRRSALPIGVITILSTIALGALLCWIAWKALEP
jgi:hypothetical protein